MPKTTRGRFHTLIWNGDEVQSKIKLEMRQRMALAVEHTRSKVVRNISRPVTKFRGPRGGRVVTNRSKPGEFPKADTGLLMKSINRGVLVDKEFVDGWIGTPLDYGVILELKMNRSFLGRTVREEQNKIARILGKPIPGGK